MRIEKINLKIFAEMIKLFRGSYPGASSIGTRRSSPSRIHNPREVCQRWVANAEFHRSKSALTSSSVMSVALFGDMVVGDMVVGDMVVGDATTLLFADKQRGEGVSR